MNLRPLNLAGRDRKRIEWLAELAIDLLDDADRPAEEREDDEREIVSEDEWGGA